MAEEKEEKKGFRVIDKRTAAQEAEQNEKPKKEEKAKEGKKGGDENTSSFA